MPSKLLAAMLLAIGVFAIADFARAGAVSLTNYLAQSAADTSSRVAAAREPAIRSWKTASGE